MTIVSVIAIYKGLIKVGFRRVHNQEALNLRILFF
jgi:hypothetical protein